MVGLAQPAQRRDRSGEVLILGGEAQRGDLYLLALGLALVDVVVDEKGYPSGISKSPKQQPKSLKVDKSQKSQTSQTSKDPGWEPPSCQSESPPDPRYP